MSTTELHGTWYCQTVDHAQSDEAAERDGEYEDFCMRGPRRASKTEFAQTTLELHDDGRYELRTGIGYGDSHGSWSVDRGDLRLTEAADVSSGFEGLAYAHLRGDRITLGFELNSDSHDGLDILVLSFGREAPGEHAHVGFVEQLLAAENEEDVDDAIEAAEGDADALDRELWDAWMAGRLAADPDADDHYSQFLQVEAFGHFREARGFTHAHAKRALTTIDHRNDLFLIVLDKLVRLPDDPQADAELAPLMASRWLDALAERRFLGGGPPESFYARPLVPQPAMDTACRAYLRKTYFTRFDAVPSLYPPADAELPTVVIRYRGPGLLEKPMALIEARKLEDQALAAAVAVLESADNARELSLWRSAILFAVMLLIRSGRELPEVVVRALDRDDRGMLVGRLSAAEQQTVKDAIASLPEQLRERVALRLHLGR